MIGVEGETVSSPPSGEVPAITFRHMSKRFRRGSETVTAVEDIDLELTRGELVCVVGPSGCGKSTLLNIAAGLMEPSKGEAFYEGRPIPSPNTATGYITQRDNLLPWRTVHENVELPLEVRGVDRSQRRERAAEMLKMVGLDGFGRSYPAELSGGMRKRASLARTLIYEPRTILADEPFGALDAQLKLVMAEEFLRIWTRTGSTVVFVTHDLLEAVTMGDRVLLLTSRPGRVKVDQRVDVPRPRDVYGAQFDPAIAEIYKHLWHELVGEMAAGEEM